MAVASENEIIKKYQWSIQTRGIDTNMYSDVRTHVHRHVSSEALHFCFIVSTKYPTAEHSSRLQNANIKKRQNMRPAVSGVCR